MANPSVSFPLSLGWVATQTLVIPALIPVIIGVALGTLAKQGSVPANVAALAAGVLAIVVAVIVLVRLPLLIYTVVFDRHVVLGPDHLRVPIVGVFQLRPWTIAISELVTITDARQGGGSTRVVLALSNGNARSFSASVLADRYEVIRAVSQRIDPRSSDPLPAAADDDDDDDDDDGRARPAPPPRPR